jgi:hypothetical protein
VFQQYLNEPINSPLKFNYKDSKVLLYKNLKVREDIGVVNIMDTNKPLSSRRGDNKYIKKKKTIRKINSKKKTS